MNREKGVAYCGLACCVCGQNATCAGCRNAGCTDRDWCKAFRCGRDRGIPGCWACEDFPCVDKRPDSPRIRAFTRFIFAHGEEALMDCLEQNERRGVVYHAAGSLEGDYDAFNTQEEILALISDGKRRR